MNKLHTMLSKVPEATALFWITKIITTGTGETMSDYLVTRFDPVYAVIASFVALVAILVWQFKTKKYSPWIYWLTVTMVSIFGTMAADSLHVIIGIPYIASTITLIVILTLIFYFWNRTEGTLSIHSITTRRREYFYWATVLGTFALGTATGDLTASTFHLGYLISGIIFAVAIAIPAIGYWKFRMNSIFAFWFAYVLTRPLGASFADWVGVSHERSGLGIGTGPVSLVLGIIIIVLVGYLAYTHEDIIPQ